MLKRKEQLEVYLQKMFETLGWENGDKSKLFQSGEQRMHRPQYICLLLWSAMAKVTGATYASIKDCSSPFPFEKFRKVILNFGQK